MRHADSLAAADAPLGAQRTRRPAVGVRLPVVVGARSRISTSGIRIRGRSTISTTIERAGRTAAGAARTFTSSGPTAAYKEDRTILVAGCGTSQAAKHALRWPNAQGHGHRLQRDERALHRGSQAQVRPDQSRGAAAADRARRRACRRRFDQIVCTGVLHHLEDPDAALRALRDVLEPDGAMHLMVYAPYGRAGVYMLQEFCRLVGMPASDDGIRALIAALEELPARHPLARLLRDAPDFRREAALADALLHPQDRAYSVPQLFEFLEGAGLRFGRWVRQAPYSPRCGVMARLPQAARIAALAPRGASRRRGALPRHDDDAQRGRVSRRRAARAARSRSPATRGSTTCRFGCRTRSAFKSGCRRARRRCLINRAHTYHDIYLPIDAQEKRLFDAIDGERSIGDDRRRRASRPRPRAVRAALVARPGRVRRVALTDPEPRRLRPGSPEGAPAAARTVSRFSPPRLAGARPRRGPRRAGSRTARRASRDGARRAGWPR